MRKFSNKAGSELLSAEPSRPSINLRKRHLLLNIPVHVVTAILKMRCVVLPDFRDRKAAGQTDWYGAKSHSRK